MARCMRASGLWSSGIDRYVADNSADVGTGQAICKKATSGDSVIRADASDGQLVGVSAADARGVRGIRDLRDVGCVPGQFLHLRALSFALLFARDFWRFRAR